jgi:hypothetical protein
MAYPSDIVIDTETFSLVSVRPTSSVRSDATTDLNTPNTLTVSHETAKDGGVQSVIYNDRSYIEACNTTCGTPASQRRVRAQFKLSYNPTGEYEFLEQDIRTALTQLITFLGVTANVTKFLNKEV